MPTDQVVTSFSSKSELGLHTSRDDASGRHIVFVGYAGAGVGALDVSNSDAVPGQDPTNPVTFAFGTRATRSPARSSRWIAQGRFSYTPTIDYGGNNGRSALLGSNGLYYTVGNANNGNATTFGAERNEPRRHRDDRARGREPDQRARTSSVGAFRSNNSAEVDPLIQYSSGPRKADKPGKDNNYRGITEFGGALYFTKGSGSNGIHTVYTSRRCRRSPRRRRRRSASYRAFRRTRPRRRAGTSRPSRCSSPTRRRCTSLTGPGNATDVSSHAGLEKWTLSSGTWQLDYVLTNGLVGTVDSNSDRRAMAHVARRDDRSVCAT